MNTTWLKDFFSSFCNTDIDMMKSLMIQWPLLANLEVLLDASFLGLSVHLGLILENKLVHINLPLAASIVHVPDLPKHLSFSPTLIVDTSNAPLDTHIAIWIIAVQSISVVEPDCFLKCLLRTWSPLQDLLCPH